MRRATASVAILCSFGLAAATSCAGKPKPPAGILLITLDTTRADHLGCYGDASASTPTLDAFSREAVRFDQAMAAVPTTLPSHSTMFTGQYPPVHGVRYNGMFRLGAESVTIAERLKDAGFATGAVPASYTVYAKSGLGQGFETYRDLFSEPGAEQLPLTAERTASDVTRLGLETIRAAGQRPFFVWLHYYDAHSPYKPPFPFSSRFREHPYDGEIAYVDAQLGELFKELRAQGLWDRIAVVVAGDHGEGLYQHGEHMHSQLAYQTTLRVPLMIKAPGAKAGTVIAEPVTLADVAPTILDIAGLPIPQGLDGISLRGACRGVEPPRRALYFETLAGSLNFGWSPIEGLRRGKWKFIRSSDPELYDLDADPSEAANLVTGDASVVSDLAETLDRNLARWNERGAPAEATSAPLDPAAMSRLASLGYIGGNVTTARRGGASPRTMVHLEGELLLLQDVMDQKLFRDALNAAKNILRDDPENRLALNSATMCSANLRDYEAAKRYANELVARYPEFVPGVTILGRIHVALNDYKSAEAIFRAGLEKSPGEPVLVYSLALALIAEKRSGEAQPLVEKALAAKSPDPSFHVLLAVCRAMAHDTAGAKAALTDAVKSGYKDQETLRNEPLLAPLRELPGFADVITLMAKKGA